MARYYLGLDQGTTCTTCLVLDESWAVRGLASVEHRQYYPQPGWVEHDPIEIWRQARNVARRAIEQAGVSSRAVRAIGVANQGETCLAWDRRTGAPLSRAIVWQDRRTAAAAERLKGEFDSLIHERTGLHIDAYFSALKYQWLLDHVPNGRELADQGHLALGTLDTWLIHQMTDRAVEVTDPSTASRTMLFNLHGREWDHELLGLLRIPPRALAKVCPSASLLGYTASREFLGATIPIAASLVDQGAALCGQACYHPGLAKTTYGTGCFMLVNTGSKPVLSQNGLLSSIAWTIGQDATYVLDGGAYVAGAAVQWLRDGLRIIASAEDTAPLARSVEDTGGVVFVPALAGLAAPYWDPNARGMILGISRATSRAHLARAALEGIAYQVADILDLMRRECSVDIPAMRADGGAAANEFLMQFQADILGIPVEVPSVLETTALGAAILAARGIGDLSRLEDIDPRGGAMRRFEPRMTGEERESRLRHWREGVARARGWMPPAGD